jgi:hypothetical protein
MKIKLIEDKNLIPPKIIFTEKAYVKMLHLLLEESKISTLEFAFFGIVTKIKQETCTEYIVSDLKIPPQQVEPTHVETNDEKYPEWLVKTFPRIEDRKSIRLHGHSHVNMSPTPSGTDQDLFQNMLDNISDYFIQLIINKAGVYTMNLFDKETKLIYEDLTINLIVKKDNTVTMIPIEKLMEPFKTLFLSTQKDGKYDIKNNHLIINSVLSLNLKTLEVVLESNTNYLNITLNNSKNSITLNKKLYKEEPYIKETEEDVINNIERKLTYTELPKYPFSGEVWDETNYDYFYGNQNYNPKTTNPKPNPNDPNDERNYGYSQKNNSKNKKTKSKGVKI